VVRGFNLIVPINSNLGAMLLLVICYATNTDVGRISRSPAAITKKSIWSGVTGSLTAINLTSLPPHCGSVTLGIELKVWRDKRPDPLDRGLEQLQSYLARLDVTEGWLVIFDRRSNALEIAERTQVEVIHSSEPYSITVIRA
jgi:hypothetical protein